MAELLPGVLPREPQEMLCFILATRPYSFTFFYLFPSLKPPPKDQLTLLEMEFGFSVTKKDLNPPMFMWLALPENIHPSL